MADDLKFGPEWLRALTDGNSVTSPPPSPAGPPKYKLAEHRYGREELLGLFVPNTPVPEQLRDFAIICVEKAQHPLAFAPPTEEEQRLQAQGVNSTLVLRMMGRGGGSMSRGRGSERGRGRGRGRGDSSYYSRFDEDGGFGRGGGPPNRSESWDDRGEHRFERSFSRGGGVGPVREFDEPRHEFSRSMSTDNWRKAERNEETETRQEDDSSWRRAGPKSSRANWREAPRGFDKEYHDRGRFDERPSFERSFSTGSRNRYKSGSSYDDEELPEWSTADNDEDIGTFDASGAFMSIKNGGKLKESPRESNRDGARGEPAKLEKQSATSSVKGVKPTTEDSSPKQDGDKLKDSEKNVPESDAQVKKQSEKTVAKKSGSPTAHGKGADKSSATKTRSDISNSVNSEGRGDTQKNSQEAAMKNSTSSAEVKNSASSGSKKVQLDRESPQGSRRANTESKDTSASTAKSKSTKANSAQKQSAQEKPGAKDSSRPKKNASPLPTDPTVAASDTAINNSKPLAANTSSQDDDVDFGHIEKVIASVTEEEEEENHVAEPPAQLKPEGPVVGLDHENAQKWFYCDPQGDIQGPFTSAEMAEWFTAGYFTMTLMVKRGCDERFSALGDLIKKWTRVPFLPGPPQPPLRIEKSRHSPVPSSASSAQPAAATVPTSNAEAAAGGVNQQAAAAEQLKLLQQHIIQQQYLQQQAILRQQLQQMQALHLQQQTQQQQDAISAGLTPQQQQQVALQLLLKQQQAQALLQQQGLQAAAVSSAASAVSSAQQPVASTAPPTSTVTAKPPAAQSATAAKPTAGSSQMAPFFQRSVSVPADSAHDSFHRSASQPKLDEGVWGTLNSLSAAAGAWGQPPASVWDIEQSGKAKSLQEIEREELEKAQRAQHKREAEKRKQEDEQRKREEEERQRKIEQKDRERKEVERQRELERHKELERQRREEEEARRLEEERKREEERRREEQRRREEEQRRLEEQRRDEERRREDERRRLEEIRLREEERLRDEERKRREEEERLRQEEELRRQEEMKRRQEKVDELRRQQQKEAMLRLQQEKMANMQLPQHAQWGSNSGPQGTNNQGLTLQQIQQIEAEKQRQEQSLRLQEQAAQLERLRLQQEKVTLSWASQRAAAAQAGGQTKSLLEIQQEQARQHLEDAKKAKQNKPVPQVQAPLATAGAWSSVVNPAQWAHEGSWRTNTPVAAGGAGFWDDVTPVPPQPQPRQGKNSKKTAKVDNSQFPALNANSGNNYQNTQKVKTSKHKKEEEAVQRLFQTMKPKDDFTQWCESVLKGMHTSVDVPTFVGFLLEVDSPYEVHDYVRSYLGESKQAMEFSKMFIEKRCQHRTHNNNKHQEEAMWGPAPAVNPNAPRGDIARATHQSNNIDDASRAAAAAGGNRKKGKKMQKVDSSILGFTCTAAAGRVNIGEIENVD